MKKNHRLFSPSDPALAEKIEAVRGHKRARSLALQCASQMRRLVEVGAFEYFLAEAAREFECTGTAPVNTLLRRLDALVVELNATHEERRAVRSDRLLGGLTLAEVIGESIS